MIFCGQGACIAHFNATFCTDGELVRVGFFTPGGKALYPSSVLMNAIPALVAGVEERVLVSPINIEKSSEILLAAA